MKGKKKPWGIRLGRYVESFAKRRNEYIQEMKIMLQNEYIQVDEDNTSDCSISAVFLSKVGHHQPKRQVPKKISFASTNLSNPSSQPKAFQEPSNPKPSTQGLTEPKLISPTPDRVLLLLPPPDRLSFRALGA